MSVRNAMLALLSEGPKYGFQLRQEFEARTGEVWPLNVGQVYLTLQRLEREGLVAAENSAETGPQKGFRITAAGSTELEAWLLTPPDLSTPPRDELVIKVLLSRQLPGVDPKRVIQAHRSYVVKLMQRWTKLKDEDDLDISFVVAVDAELFRLDSIVRWLDSTDGKFRRAAKEPTEPTTPPLPRRRMKVNR